jgi:hypothetical protein
LAATEQPMAISNKMGRENSVDSFISMPLS